MSDAPFDLPPASAGFPARGRWLIDHLMPALSLTENQAAGIVGNLGFESAGLTILQEESPLAGRGGYGWAQWTGSRRVAYEHWCSYHALDPASDEANYRYVLVDFTGTYAYVVRHLTETTTLNDAVFCVGRYYEAPAGTTETNLPGFLGRLTYAKRALAGADVPPPASQLPTAAQLQAWLNAEGYNLTVDGWWGPRSGAALQSHYDKIGRST